MKQYKVALITIACTLITIAPVILIAVYSPDEKISEDVKSILWIYLYITLAIILLLLIVAFFGTYIISFMKYKFKKVYSEFVYEDIETILEFIDDGGKEVCLYSSVELKNISIRFKKEAKTTVYTDVGKVISMSRNGSDLELIKDEDNEIIYRVNFSKNNVRKKKTKFHYSAVFKDAFDKEDNNFWETGPIYFCEKFSLTLISQDKTFACTVKKGTINEATKKVENWYLHNNISYINYNKYGKKLLRINLNNIKDSERYRIYWDEV